MRKNPEDFPNPPAISVSNPNDTIAAINAAGEKGYAIVALVHCNGSARLMPYQTGIYHWVIVEGLDNQNIRILNPWQGDEEVFTLDFFRKATSGTIAGLLIIFERILPFLAPKPVPAPAPAPPPAPPVPPAPKPVDPCAAKDAEIAALQAQLADKDKTIASLTARITSAVVQAAQADDHIKLVLASLNQAKS